MPHDEPMKRVSHFPLMAKVLGWLVLHLIILALAFTGFVRWQLHLGLNSLLSGAAGERIKGFAQDVAQQIIDLPPPEWDQAMAPLAREKGVKAHLYDDVRSNKIAAELPANVMAQIRATMPPRHGRPQHMRPPPMEPMMRVDFVEEKGEGWRDRIKCRPQFLMRGDDRCYWAGVLIELPLRGRMPGRPIMLLIQAETLDGSGMFFDVQPWLWGGLGVLFLSLVFWTPFAWRMKSYLQKLTSAAEQIAAGRFEVSLPRRSDELGQLGQSIEVMADRLSHLIGGQKRFLGDAAHELCAPLSRLRTALGILENRVAPSLMELLKSVEADAAELASLVEEILSFSRAGNHPPMIKSIPLGELIDELIARECSGMPFLNETPRDLVVAADPKLLRRALSNLLRNTQMHAGLQAKMHFSAELRDQMIHLTVSDNGPGVPDEELSRIFAPFYRLDPARGRETGGTGLGLAIVRTCIEACGGEVSASLAPEGGLRIHLKLLPFRDDLSSSR